MNLSDERHQDEMKGNAMTATTASAGQRHLSRLLPNITAGLVIGFIEVIFSVSIASLIFSGPLKPYLPRGIAIVLVTTNRELMALNR